MKPRGSHALAAGLALSVCLPAHAFPILIAGVGTGLLGAVFLPLALLLALVLALLWSRPAKNGAAFHPRLVTPVACGLAVFATLAVVTPSWKEKAVEALAVEAEPSSAAITVRFEYLGKEEQSQLSQAMDADSFIQGVIDRRLEVFWLDKSRVSQFRDMPNRFSIEDVSEDPTALTQAIEGSTKQVVLIDDSGALAGSIARDIAQHFDVDVRFLAGGTNGLNEALWASWQLSDTQGSLEFGEWQQHLRGNPDTAVLSVVVPDEFQVDGWIHGDYGLPIGAYLAGFDYLTKQLEGRSVLISGAENTFTGHTWLLVRAMRAAGLDVKYIRPEPGERLVKPPYVSPYQGSDTIMPLDEALLIGEMVGGVTFLDFQGAGHANDDSLSSATVVRIGADRVAKGELGPAIQALNPDGARFIGVAYDKASLYHAVMAGEMVSRSGGVWLGVAVHPDALDGDYHPLTLDSSAFRFLLTGSTVVIAQVGAALISIAGDSPEPALFFACMLAGLALGIRATFLRWAATGLAMLAAHSTLLADSWILSSALSASRAVGICLVAFSIGALISREMRWHVRQPDQALPPKIALLLEARKLGFRIPKTTVISRQSISTGKLPLISTRRRLIVRSAARSESSSYRSAGLYESIRLPVGGDLWAAVDRVLAAEEQEDANPSCFVQPLISEGIFGVLMFGSGPDAHMVLGEYGLSDSVTAGRGRARKLSLPIWSARTADGYWSSPVNALLRLNETMGATGIEFAITESGDLTLLQVVVDTNGRESLGRIKRMAKKRVALAASHADPLTAAAMAAMAMGGEQIAVGKCRFVLEQPLRRVMHAFADDSKHLLGWFSPAMFFSLPADQLEALFDELDAARARYRRVSTFDLTAGDTELMEHLRAELANAQAIYGRFSRLTTLAVEITGVRLARKIGEPITRVKARCSEAFDAELNWMAPLFAELLVRGLCEPACRTIGTSLGQVPPKGALEIGSANGVVTIKELFEGVTLESASVWNVPASGFRATLSSSSNFMPGDALLIEDTDIMYLPQLEQCSAVVSINGSALSHLMQHARRLHIPYVVGAGIKGGGQFKQREVVIKPTGEVQHA